MNELVRNLEPAETEVERVVAAAKDALTDEMVARLAGTAGEAMELLDQVQRAGLGRAIPALAELVHNGDLDRLAQLARVYASAQDAMTDEMVCRLTEAVSGGLEFVDQAHRAGLAKAIPALAEMVNNGDLERLSQLARLYASAQDAVTDEMVGRLAETVGEGLSLLDRLNRGGAVHVVQILENLDASGALERVARILPRLVERLDLMERVLGCVDAAADESRVPPPGGGGLIGLWRMMRDPETQATMRFMMSLGKRMRENCGAVSTAGTPR